MIVNNFTPSSTGALQGVDFLARAAKADAKDSGEAPKFSDLLGASGSNDATAPALRETRQPARAATPESADGKSHGVGFDAESPRVSLLQPADSMLSDVPVTPSGLDAAPPLFRDPRLDDPAELALEAAAMALAASLLEKPLECQAQPVATEEFEGGLTADQRGRQPRSMDQSDKAAVLSRAGMVGLVPIDVFAQVGSQGSAAQTKLEEGYPQVESLIPDYQAQVGSIDSHPAAGAPVRGGSVLAGRTYSATDEVLVRASLSELVSASRALISAVEPIVTELVLAATPSQAVAVAGAGKVLVPTILSTARLFAPTATDVTSQKPLASQVMVPVPAIAPESADATGELSALTALAEASDGAFLSSPVPESPVKAFFAAQAQQHQESTPVSASGLVESTAPVGKIGEVAVPVGGEGQFGGESSGDPARQDEGAGSQSRDLNAAGAQPQAAQPQAAQPQAAQPQAAQPQAAQPQAAQPQAAQRHSADQTETQPPVQEFGSELGTVGAKDGAVKMDKSPVTARTEESSAAVSFDGEGAYSVSSPAIDSSGAALGQLASGEKHVHETVSRPTVLPPVHAKTTELFNVVQSALERARSENPSHLAVEVTLEDGSSFGLEVRMSSSGLQASFRSESQPLLKALESGWAGFLAKESVDSKVNSASFEGRSGFGEFSNNGSGAGEKRQQFEDSASSASLRSPSDSKGALRDSQQGLAGSTANRPQVSSRGIALYA
jgi:hypothetical protein